MEKEVAKTADTWRIVQRQESWHVLNQDGVLLVSFPTRAEGQAWVAGVRYGIDGAILIFQEAKQDIDQRWEGATRSIQRTRVDTTGIAS
jgi:hypothetical protein